MFWIVDGGWGEWGDWEQCSLSCGEGVQSRHRLCDSPAPFSGADNIWHDCTEDGSSGTESRACNEDPCQSKYKLSTQYSYCYILYD